MAMLHVHASAVQAMLAGDGLPEGGTDLVTLHSCQYCIPPSLHLGITYALAGLEVDL